MVTCSQSEKSDVMMDKPKYLATLLTTCLNLAALYQMEDMENGPWNDASKILW